MKTQSTELIAIATLLVLVVVGCGASSTSTPGVAKTTFPTGAFALAEWVWTFGADGSFVARGPGTGENGIYTTIGAQVTFVGDYCGKDVKGTYTWTFDGKELTFEAVNDQCGDRRAIVERGRWVKQP